MCFGQARYFVTSGKEHEKNSYGCGVEEGMTIKGLGAAKELTRAEL